MIKKEQKIIEVLSLKVLIISLLFIVSLFVFAFLAHGVVLGKQRSIDNKIFSFFDSFTTPGLVKLMTFFSFFGSVYFLVPAYVVLIGYFFLKKNFRAGIDIAIIALSSTAMMFGLKILFHRVRPNLPIIQGIHTYSFPSGHALSSFIFCSILIFIIRNSTSKTAIKWIVTIGLLLIAITIGVSRIILRMHYPTDVIASLCLGIVWVIISFSLLRKINLRFLIKDNLSPAEKV